MYKRQIYIGAEGGYGLSHSDWSWPVGTSASEGLSGGVGGVFVGYQKQWFNLVGGVEGSADWAGLSGSAPCPGPGYECQTKIQSLESLRARFGVTSGPLLAFGTAGIGWEQNDHHAVYAANPAFDRSSGVNTLTGWVAGVGLDYQITPSVILGAQYLHYGFGSQDGAMRLDTSAAVVGTPTFSNQNVDAIEARVSYKFGQ